jgi:hypothetical protein
MDPARRNRREPVWMFRSGGAGSRPREAGGSSDSFVTLVDYLLSLMNNRE